MTMIRTVNPIKHLHVLKLAAGSTSRHVVIGSSYFVDITNERLGSDHLAAAVVLPGPVLQR
ncbi:hypothetical protein E8E14_000262 [Neopestalotiopsis sp. 37M]|nr:hypothetical protein E8E14_000262 [Neopestalotiopsis sp. 37M]